MRRILTALAAVAATFCLQAEVWQAEYGVARVFNFKLYNADGTLDVDEVDSGTEVSLSCNEGAETTATNDFADEGNFYSISLTAAELQCERVAIVVAATTTEVFFVETFGHASAFNETLGWLTGDSFARLGAPAGASVSADIAAIEGQTDDIGAAGAGLTAIDLPNQTMDITGNLSGSVGSVTAVSSGAITEASFATTPGSFEPLGIIDQGTAQSATGTTLVLRAAVTFADDELNGAEILITGGTGVGQTRLITDYVSATDTATVATWTTTPAGTITYQVRTDTATGGSVSIGVGGIAANSFAAGAIDATAIATGAVDADAIADNAIDAGAIAADAIGDTEVSDVAGVLYAFGIVDQGTAQSATASTLVLRAAASFANDEILGATCLITGGSTGVGQSRTVTDYDSASDTATVDAWTTTPTGTITYRCFGTAPGGAGSTLTQADVRTAVGLSAANLDTQLSAIDDYVDTEVADILTDTSTTLDDLIDTEIAALVTAVDTVDNFVDTEVAAILEDTGTTLDDFIDTEIAALVTAVDTVDNYVDTEITTIDDFLDTEITALMNARTQIFPGNADADSVLTADSGDTNTLVDAELTFGAAEDIAGAYVVREDGQRCFVDSFNAATDTIEFAACVFTGAWSTQTYKIYPAGTQ